MQNGGVGLLIPENLKFKVNKAIFTIKKMATNPACKFILFNTWPSKQSYPKNYCYTSMFIDESITKKECCSPVINNLIEEYQLINQCL